MRETQPHILRPLAALVLMAAAVVWVIGSHWTAPVCPADLSAAVAGSGSGTPAAGDGRCAAGADDTGAQDWGWTAGTLALAGIGVGLLSAAEVERRRRLRTPA